MNGTIIIENQTGRHLQYRLDHQTVCVKVGKCFCKKGRRGTVTSTIHVPGGKGKRTLPLHPAVALCPAVKADAQGPHPKIKIIGFEAKQATKPEAKAKAQADSTKPEEKSDKGSGGRKGKNN